MPRLSDALDNGFRLKGLGKTEMPPTPGVHPKEDAFIHADLGGFAAGLKTGRQNDTEKIF